MALKQSEGKAVQLRTIAQMIGSVNFNIAANKYMWYQARNNAVLILKLAFGPFGSTLFFFFWYLWMHSRRNFLFCSDLSFVLGWLCLLFRDSFFLFEPVYVVG